VNTQSPIRSRRLYHDCPWCALTWDDGTHPCDHCRVRKLREEMDARRALAPEPEEGG
jgi:predicted heme/steroid binding protein